MTPHPSALARLPPTSPGMRIGLLGGSFNPPHGGHRHITLEAFRRLALDRVWWLVTPGNPIKSQDDLASLEARMTLAANLADHPRIDITGFEAEIGTAYTAEALGYLRQRLPGVNFVWLMGADNLASFHKWQRWSEIMASIPIAVVDRPGWRNRAVASLAARRYAGARIDERAARNLPILPAPAWTLLSLRLCDLSSTEIRRQMQLAPGPAAVCAPRATLSDR